MKPFGPESLTGVELELFAPTSASRLTLAQAWADKIAGRLRYGLKYSSEGRVHDGRPVCTLTPAFTVIDADGNTVATLVDDTTIREDLNEESDTPDGWFRVVMDDLRLALLAERRAFSDESPTVESVLAPLIELFEGHLEEPQEDAESLGSKQRILTDRYGHPVAVVAGLLGERHRVCEVVLAPMSRDTRSERLQFILRLAQDLDFGIPTEAAVHVHFDATPWKSTPKLRAFITRSHTDHALLRQRFPANPRCRGIGPPPDAVVRVATEARADLPFKVFSTALEMAQAHRRCDFNLLGIIRQRPLHPTLESRAHEMTLDAATLLSRIAELEDYLLSVWNDA